MRIVLPIVCLVCGLALAGCDGGSSSKGGLCLTDRPTDTAIKLAYDAYNKARTREPSNAQLVGVSDCDADGVREVWLRQHPSDRWVAKFQLRHADNGRWYLVSSEAIEVPRG
jgi:hypothetical protein